MKIFKRAMAMFLVLVMLVPVMTVFAENNSPQKISLKGAKATAKSVTYNGRKQKAEVTVTLDGKTLTEGEDYVLAKDASKKKAGKYTITINGVGKYSGTLKTTYTIKKAKPTISVTGKTTVKASVLKKKAVSFKWKTKVQEKAKVSYVSFNKNIKVTAKGKVTLKKGLKKGDYKIKITTAATNNYKKAVKKVTIKVK